MKYEMIKTRLQVGIIILQLVFKTLLFSYTLPRLPSRLFIWNLTLFSTYGDKKNIGYLHETSSFKDITNDENIIL